MTNIDLHEIGLGAIIDEYLRLSRGIMVSEVLDGWGVTQELPAERRKSDGDSQPVKIVTIYRGLSYHLAIDFALKQPLCKHHTEIYKVLVGATNDR